MFLKEKRCGKVKGQACANGRKQWSEWTKEDSISPTVATKSVMLTAMIEAHEERKVACYNIPGAFLHADLGEDVIMVLKGQLAELMVQVAPNLYRKYVNIDRRGKPILCIKLQKALYGLMRSALLFYRKLAKDLESNGFTINPYDPCVANKTVNSTQMTVCWHLNDLKVSHKEGNKLIKFGDWLNNTFGVNVVSH